LALDATQKKKLAALHPEATVMVDNRGESLKAIFLKKNPFEERFFKNDGLRMIRIRPSRVSYASGLRDTFKAEL
jgi:hypothetical protein